jgi:uncharacterized protein involved in response to NO
MRNWLRTLLFISAFAPALLTLSWVRYSTYGYRTDVLQLLVVGILGTILPLLIVTLARQTGESLSIQAKKIESNDVMLIAFIASYMLPLITKSSELSFDEIIGILAVIGFILWLINSLPCHPLLRIFKYRSYKVEAATGMVYTLITRRDIKDPRQPIMVKKISETMLMEA